LVAIHFLIGILTGSVFRVRVLLALVAVVFFECLAAALALGAAAALWPLTGLVAVQIGYLGGLLIRSVLVSPNLVPASGTCGRLKRFYLVVREERPFQTGSDFDCAKSIARMRRKNHSAT
jgi:hypothetical protein